MVEKRKPLILASTKTLLNALSQNPNNNNSNSLQSGNCHVNTPLSSSSDSSPLFVQVQAGILKFPNNKNEIPPRISSLDHSSLIGLPVAILKRLAITSGTLVLIKNLETNVQRIGQVVVLDPPISQDELVPDEGAGSCAADTMLVFPSLTFCKSYLCPLSQNLAYLSPLLAFNVDLHTSCLTSLLRHGNESLASIFDVHDYVKKSGGLEDCAVNLRLEPWPHVPRYASHLRISFVKIPECGTIESLKGKSSIETMDRQEMIDLALQDYFNIDRYLAKDDVFRIKIDWNCNSVLCVSCSLRKKNDQGDIIYFKVVGLDPPEEPILRVNREQTALVLGGSAAAAFPPDLLISEPVDIAPLQRDTIKSLGSILTPRLCPSVFSSKFGVSILLHGLAGSGKRTVVRYVARRLGLHVVEYSCNTLMEASENKSSSLLTQAFSTAHRYSPAILLLRHFDVLRNLASSEGLQCDHTGLVSEIASVIRKFTQAVVMAEENSYEEKLNGVPQLKSVGAIRQPWVLLVAAAESTEGLPPAIRRCFSHELNLAPLTEEERAKMLTKSLQNVSEILDDADLECVVKDIVAQTSGFTPRDLRSLIADAGANLIPKDLYPNDPVKTVDNDSLVHNPVQAKTVEEDIKTPRKEDLLKALERSKKRNASALGAPKVPNVIWEDVGGLEDVKKAILDTVQLPLLHKELFSSGLRKRSGVLLYGPPGTGKTLLAKAVATECSLNFLSVKGPELINMYIGESEKNVRDIFQKARSARPCVIFFDELDSLAPARGASGDSGGVMDRVVSQMLAEIDGLSDSTQDLFVIGASNRPDLIDPALLRPGRFDKLLYVGVNADPSYRERVLKALTRKFQLHEDVSLYAIAKRCPPNFSGADMYALCADAWFQAAKRQVSSSASDSSSNDNPEDAVVVEYEDFIKVLGELAPSLSLAELRKYETLRDQFGGGSN
ncbi:peroxisomal ATPase PEX6 isoform X2 [Amaranthus tricolor]|uniref:peroxisomal ATPase PEX6 isoform X2 n=1 Tax=Amaranthus tricolor TaxID=29722 RepID=UPI0025908DA8|nr:peroxisomal ATPase PEX6 isoform X2 [Amaranthus tricolor]